MRVGAHVPNTHKVGSVNAERLRDSIRRLATGGGGTMGGFSNTVESVRHQVLRPEPLLRITQRGGTMTFIPGIHGFSSDEVDNSKWRMGP